MGGWKFKVSPWLRFDHQWIPRSKVPHSFGRGPKTRKNEVEQLKLGGGEVSTDEHFHSSKFVGKEFKFPCLSTLSKKSKFGKNGTIMAEEKKWIPRFRNPSPAQPGSSPGPQSLFGCKIWILLQIILLRAFHGFMEDPRIFAAAKRNNWWGSSAYLHS